MLQHTGLSYNDKISARNTILVTSDNNKLSPSYYKLQKKPTISYNDKISASNTKNTLVQQQSNKACKV